MGAQGLWATFQEVMELHTSTRLLRMKWLDGGIANKRGAGGVLFYF